MQLFRAHVAVVAEKLSAAEAKKLGFGATALGKLKVLANMKDDEFDEVATIVINKYRELLSDKYSAEVVGHVLHQRLQDAVEQAPEFATKYTHPSGKAKVNLKVFTQFVLSALAIKLLYGAGVHSSCAFDPRNLNTAMLLPDFADL